MPDTGTDRTRSAPARRAEPPGGAQFSSVLEGVVRSFHACSDAETLLARVVASALRLFPGAQGASVGWIAGRRLTFRHSTSDLVREADRLQAEVGEGPCFDALHERERVLVSDLRHEQRWPTFTGRADRHGFRSMLSLPLSVEDRTLGVLNLVGRQTGAFDREAQEISEVLAEHAALGLATAFKLEQLQRAVDGRDVIGQAKGVLMERYGLDQDRAFGVLTRISQRTHRKLHDVARELVTTRRLEDLDSAARLPT